ncbi:MAG TPA: TonB-dependent receptor, partial [Blastocatellia bacterium]|nr:TonB-dependent receptor [Blastocatellia bacterium]
RSTETDSSGNYQVAALPVGTYRIEVKADGFSTQSISELRLEVSQITVQNFQMQVGGVTQQVTVTAQPGVVETTTTTVGQVISQRTVQEIPLNGRHFVDLGLLIPGSVTPPQNGFLTAPLRGQGSFAFNTAGNREDTVNFMINGVNLNDMVQNQITFQPSINTLQEFKVDNSTYSAEYGRNSGAIVNIATRSGSNDFHGEAFEFLRNDAFDARNFFDATIPPFKRNQFGVALGGPVRKENTFFFFTYEGTRQRQGLTLNGNTLTDAQRAGVTDPVVQKLLDFIPHATRVDTVLIPTPAQPAGVPTPVGRFQGSATAPVNIDQFTGDVSHVIGKNDRLHGYYVFQRDLRGEPTLQGNTLPNFGDTRQSHRQIFTLNETHSFGSNLVNEARFGFNRIHITFTPNQLLNPADFGIKNGINEPIGLPQISITGFNFNFGGPSGFPQGRGDTTFVLADSASYLRGPHSLKFGGEWRRFLNNNFARNIGTFAFAQGAPPNPASAFQAGNANSFNVSIGDVSSSIAQGALGFFVQDNYKLKPHLTLELGLRYDWFMSPTERYDRFVVFDPTRNALVQVGSGIDQVYKTNHSLQPRVGFAWDIFKDGKTVVRGAYAILADQPVTNLITGTAANPPLAIPLTFNGPIKFDNAVTVAAAAGLAPASVDQDYTTGDIQSWNLNVQREITPTLALTVGYFGSKGSHLRIQRNINQFINGVRPFAKLSPTSPILPGATVGNILENSSGGNSTYNGLWITANKRLSGGLSFNGSYTFSKSLDYNSLNSQGVVVQNSYDIRADKGLSDYDARHRFVANAIYELPFKGNRLVEGWQFGTIVQYQTGNPVNLLVGSIAAPPAGTAGPPALNAAALTGVATLRPDVSGSVVVTGKPNQWFTNSVCDPRPLGSCPSGAVFTVPVVGSTLHFGNMGRNVIIGPGFSNTDFSILKTTKITETVRVQFRTEFFDLFNHANFGQPGRTVVPNSTQLGVITNTRFPTGDSGSSRQVQFALKLIF